MRDLEEKVGVIVRRYESDTYLQFGVSITTRCRHLQEVEPLYVRMQKLMRQIDKYSDSYAPTTVHIPLARTLWEERTADDLDPKINPYWADQCNR